MSIQDHRQTIRSICFELGIKYDDKFANGNTMIDEEKLLRERVKQLQNEKIKRLDEHKILASRENDLCERLDEKKTFIKSIVPTENEIEALKCHIKELEKLQVSKIRLELLSK
jgi:hypothetical protein